MMTFLLFAPASTKWLGWPKHKKSRRNSLQYLDFVTLIVQSYFDTLLRYVLSVTFCGTVVMKVIDQKTLVKHSWSYKVRRTVYILTLSEFARHEFTNLWLKTFNWTLPDTLSLSLTRIRLGPKQARRVNDSTASLSLTERWTITEIRPPSHSVLTYSLLTDVHPL